MMKKFLGLMLTLTIAFSVGCAGPGSNTVAGNVATGATINALAGVPGAGLVGLAAMTVDAISNSRRPEIKKWSPEFSKHVLQSPLFSFRCKDLNAPVCKDEDIEVSWRPRKKDDGSLITSENAPKRSMEYTEAYVKSADHYLHGIFGDTPEMQQRNLKAWEEGKTVVAEYHRPNNANLVYVSTGREPAEIMLTEEWAVRKAGVAAVKPEDAKEPVNVTTDKTADKKESASDSSAQSVAPKEPVSTSTVNSGSDTEPNGKN